MVSISLRISRIGGLLPMMGFGCRIKLWPLEVSLRVRRRKWRLIQVRTSRMFPDWNIRMPYCQRRRASKIN